MAHVGGRRCQHEGCLKSAGDATRCCVAHGGGRRCQEEGCLNAAACTTWYFKAHEVGRLCQHEGCPKSAPGSGAPQGPKSAPCRRALQGTWRGGGGVKKRGAPSQRTRLHSIARNMEGRRCRHEGCPKLAICSTGYPKAHGGGGWCQHEGCPMSAEGSTGITRHMEGEGGVDTRSA